MTKIKNEHTLFRFVSLRNPELSEKKNQKRRFVFHFDDKTGAFFDAVKNKPSDKTKWEAMLTASESFDELDSEARVEEIVKELYGVAQWIGRNRYSLDVNELRDKTKSLNPLSQDIERVLWDNLFFQVLTHKSFYVKEDILQVLVLQNLLKQVKDLTDEKEILLNLPVLANAKVILPVFLFQENREDSSNTLQKASSLKPNTLFSTKELEKSISVSISQSNITIYDSTIAVLKKLQKQFRSNYESAYNTAVSQYEAKVKLAYANATIVEREETDCPTGCKKIIQEYQNLLLPDFIFEEPKEVNEADLRKYLSEEQYYVLESLDLLSSASYDEIIESIETAIREETTNTFDKLSFSKKSIAVNGVVLGENVTAKNSSITEYPFIAYFLKTSNSSSNLVGKICMSLDLGFPNGDLIDALYTAHFPNNTNNTNGAFTDVANGNFINIVFYPNTGLSIPTGTTQFTFEGKLTFSNGLVLNFNFTMDLTSRIPGIATSSKSSGDDGSLGGNNGTPFIPKGFGYRQIGIADYKKVVQEICCYTEGEVAHIENIMAREFKEKTTVRERIEENTTTTEQTVETENLTDSTSTERFEMQSEVAKILQEDRQFGAYAVVKGKMSPNTTFEVGANYATNSSKEQSNRQAVNQSKEITQRAMERIVSKIRKEQITKITESFKDTNSHIFDNRAGENHVSGVYRWVNKVYRNQVQNYGKRMMYEFLIPQPSKLHRLAMRDAVNHPTTTVLVKPDDPRLGGKYAKIETSKDLNANNYHLWASIYNVEVEMPPQPINVAKEYYKKQTDQGAKDKMRNGDSMNIEIPQGYYCDEFSGYGKYVHEGNAVTTQFSLTVGSFNNFNLYVGRGSFDFTRRAISKINKVLPIAIIIEDIEPLAMTFIAHCKVSDELYAKWQVETFGKLIEAYQKQLDDYNAKMGEVATTTETTLGTNPGFYREIEQMVLRKNCISYLMDEAKMGAQFYTGDALENYVITQNQAMDDYGSFAKFMEQAFDWDLISYNFYPYYWGNRTEWTALYQTENDDPLFRSFMQAGMARVIVTVRPGFEDAVMYYMSTGRIWNGGEVPVIGDPLYLSIVDELKEQEYVVEETWETVVPSALVALQSSGVAVDATGLPCGDDCKDAQENNPLKNNDSKLGVTISTSPN